jgi:hypothetical protein
MTSRKSGIRGGAVAALAWALAGLACQKPQAEASRVVVRNPDYLVIRPIRREADAEHPIRVDLPYSGAGYGFAASSALLDMNSFHLGAAGFAGGRTSVVGEATIWIPLTPEGNRRLEEWSSHSEGDFLGIFLKGKLVAAPQVKSRMGGGLPLRVSSKSEGDLVLKELRGGGAIE